MLRHKYHQKLTSYEAFVRADQAERPPQVFSTVRLRHVLMGIGTDKHAVRINEESAGWLKPVTVPEQVCT